MEKIYKHIFEFPIISGALLFVIATVLLLVQIKRNEPLNMHKHTVMTWKGIINTWAVITILYIIALGFIFGAFSNN